MPSLWEKERQTAPTKKVVLGRTQQGTVMEKGESFSDQVSHIGLENE